MKIYSVYDAKVDAFAQPFFMRTRGEAIRGWESVCNDSSTQMFQYPQDFALFELGEFDLTTGRFENSQVPLSLGLAVQYKKAATDAEKQMPLAMEAPKESAVNLSTVQ